MPRYKSRCSTTPLLHVRGGVDTPLLGPKHLSTSQTFTWASSVRRLNCLLIQLETGTTLRTSSCRLMLLLTVVTHSLHLVNWALISRNYHEAYWSVSELKPAIGVPKITFQYFGPGQLFRNESVLQGASMSSCRVSAGLVVPDRPGYERETTGSWPYWIV